MIVSAPINRLVARMIVLAISLSICAVLGLAATSNYLVGVLTDERLPVPKGLLVSARSYFPDSARLNARLANVELMETERDLSLAESYALRAANLSPWDYNHQLLLATIKESAGDRAAAEVFMRKAIALAPNNADVRWRMANLLLRQGKLAESLEEFQRVNSSSQSYLPATLGLLWRSTNGNADALESAIGSDPLARLVLAQFLLKQSRVQEAGKIFRSVNRRVRLESREGPAFLHSLVDSDQIEMARYLWVDMVGRSDTPSADFTTLIWNGSFESDIFKDFDHFDWTLSSNEYARIAITSGIARTGARALMIDFLGRDTTRLDREVKQLVLIRPGARYRLECYAKSEDLKTPAGPRLMVMRSDETELIAESDAVAEGTTDWHRLAVDFVAPKDSRALVIAIKRLPRFNYDDPTEGRVWFDDFMLTELKEGQ